MLPSLLGLVGKVEQGVFLRVVGSGVTPRPVLQLRVAVYGGLLAAEAEVGGHAARSISSPVIASTSADTMTSATGGVTALPYCLTRSRLLPSTV